MQPDRDNGAPCTGIAGGDAHRRYRDTRGPTTALARHAGRARPGPAACADAARCALDRRTHIRFPDGAARWHRAARVSRDARAACDARVVDRGDRGRSPSCACSPPPGCSPACCAFPRNSPRSPLLRSQSAACPPHSRRRRSCRRVGRCATATLFVCVAVSLIGTIAMIVYPTLTELAGWDLAASATFLGASIHEVAQVVGASFALSPEHGELAILTKLLRVALLAPVVMLLRGWSIRHGRCRWRNDPHKASVETLPTFLIVFIALVAIGSFVPWPQPLVGQRCTRLAHLPAHRGRRARSCSPTPARCCGSAGGLSC